jgi:hypothetical protein
MNNPDVSRLRLKEPAGWFAAGAGFRRTLSLLSDGAFKLFAYFSLEADRPTGCLAATQKELANALGKSKRIIGTYVAELQAKEICLVKPGKNQFTATVYEIADAYWPYHRTPSSPEAPEIRTYVESVRGCFEGLGCTCGKFGAAGTEAARQLQRQGIPINLVLDAMILGACRKFDSWFNGGPAEPIRSMAYFVPLIAEIQAKPLPAGYSTHLRSQLQRLSETWSKGVRDRKGS